LVKFRNIFKGDTQCIPIGKGILALDIAQHRFFYDGNLADILKGSNVLRSDAGRIVERAMKSGTFVGPLKYAPEFFELQDTEFFRREAFQNRIPEF